MLNIRRRAHHRSFRTRLASTSLRWCLALGSTSVALLPPGPAVAADPGARESARRLVLEGDAFSAQQDHAAALDRYQQAYRLVHVPTVGIEVMKAQQALGKLVDANATALEVAALPKQPNEPAVFDRARLQAAQVGLRLGAMIPTLWIDLAPRGLAHEVEIDGKVPREEPPYHLDPGLHEVRLSARGYEPLQLQVNLLEAERQTLTATLFEEAQARPSASEPTASGSDGAANDAAAAMQAARDRRGDAGARTLGWLGIGVAGLAAGVGSFAGISALQTKPDCPANVCAPSQREDIDSSKRMGVVANVSFGVAIVAGGLGLWQLLSHPEDGPERRAALPAGVSLGLGTGPFELSLSGRF
jgi:hypothetical protein